MITRLCAAVQWQMIMCAVMLGSLQHPLLANKQPVRLSAITFLVNSATSHADVASNLDLTSGLSQLAESISSHET